MMAAKKATFLVGYKDVRSQGMVTGRCSFG